MWEPQPPGTPEGLSRPVMGIALLITHSGVATMASGSNACDKLKFCVNDMKTESLTLVYHVLFLSSLN